jgi:hypothetical protein
MALRSFAKSVIWTGIIAGLSHNAQAQAIKIDPTTIVFGQTVRYYIDPPLTPPVSTYTWEYKCTAPATTGWGPMSATNSDSTETVVEALPGSFSVRCSITFKRMSDGSRPDPITLSLDVVVPKPDGATITGLGQATQLGTDYPITFQVTQGGQPSGYIKGFAQEQATNLKLFDYQGNATSYADSGWSPASPDDPLAGRFTIKDGGRIVDLKNYNDENGAGYANRLVGEKLETLTQEVRIKFTYADGTVDYASLGKVNFTYKKAAGDSMYEID